MRNVTNEEDEEQRRKTRALMNPGYDTKHTEPRYPIEEQAKGVKAVQSPEECNSLL
jgi:hypothetical protein